MINLLKKYRYYVSHATYHCDGDLLLCLDANELVYEALQRFCNDNMILSEEGARSECGFMGLQRVVFSACFDVQMQKNHPCGAARPKKPLDKTHAMPSVVTEFAT